MPGEPREPRELGIDAPREGLYLREEIDMRCNFLMASFVKKTLRKAHHVSSERIIAHASQAMATGAFPLTDASGAKINPLGQVPAAGLGLDSYFSSYASNPPGAPIMPVAVPTGVHHSRPTQMHPAMATTHISRDYPNSRRSLPPHCRCEGAIHATSCPYYHPDDGRGISYSSSYPHNHQSQDPLRDYHSTVPSLASAASQRRTHQYSVSAISLPSNVLHELYGTMRADQCLCTGAIHNESCPGYPGLRTPGSISTPPTAETTTAFSQHTTTSQAQADHHHHQLTSKSTSQPASRPPQQPSSQPLERHYTAPPDVSPLPVYAQLVAKASPPLGSVRQHFGDDAAISVRPETPPSPPTPGRAMTHDFFHYGTVSNHPYSMSPRGEGALELPRARTWSEIDRGGGGDSNGGGPVIYR